MWLQASVTNTLISTGGGFYRQENLKEIGTVVFLDSPFDKIIKRIKNHPNAEKKLKKTSAFKQSQKSKRALQ